MWMRRRGEVDLNKHLCFICRDGAQRRRCWRGLGSEEEEACRRQSTCRTENTATRRSRSLAHVRLGGRAERGVKRRENPRGCWEFPATPQTSSGQQQQERMERRFKPGSPWEGGGGGGGGGEVEVHASKLTAALHPSPLSTI